MKITVDKRFTLACDVDAVKADSREFNYSGIEVDLLGEFVKTLRIYGKDTDANRIPVNPDILRCTASAMAGENGTIYRVEMTLSTFRRFCVVTFYAYQDHSIELSFISTVSGETVCMYSIETYKPEN